MPPLDKLPLVIDTLIVRSAMANSIAVGAGKQVGDRAETQSGRRDNAIREWFLCRPLNLDQQRREERFYRRRVIHRLSGKHKCFGFELAAAVCARPKMEDVLLVFVFRPYRSNQKVSALRAVHPEDGTTIQLYRHDGNLLPWKQREDDGIMALSFPRDSP